MNIDGLPLYKSSNKQFWVILVKVFYKPDVYEPFPVAIFYGTSKPPLDLFLQDFIQEFNNLHEVGLTVDEKHFTVDIQCFICDTPARAYLKNVKGHMGYSACERCTVNGIPYKKNETDKKSKVVYPTSECPARTNESFRSQDCPEHHNGDTPLVNIPGLDIVLHFVLDFMHLLCLGIMKKFLLYWLQDKRYKISPRDKETLSADMENFRNQVPVEFHRKPRRVTHVGMFKATELRFFLLYGGPIVLKNCLSANKYKHFLFLHVACRILCFEKYAVSKNEQAKYYLQMFADAISSEYDVDALVINAHNLIHLADDAKNMKCNLSYISAFSFENFLGSLKRLLRSRNRPLAQVCRRLSEKFLIQNKKNPKLKNTIEILRERKDENGMKHVTKLYFKMSTLTCRQPNNLVLLKDKSIFAIQDMFELNDTINLVGRVVTKKGAIFDFPCNSTQFDMYELKNEMSAVTQFDIQDVERKLVRLTIERENRLKIYAMPLLH